MCRRSSGFDEAYRIQKVADRFFPPAAIEGPLAAMWWAAKGDWKKAHTIVQDDDSQPAAWVHAYLHRVEGDVSNAAYWYRNAGKPVANGELSTEWDNIVTTLTA